MEDLLNQRKQVCVKDPFTIFMVSILVENIFIDTVDVCFQSVTPVYLEKGISTSGVKCTSLSWLSDRASELVTGGS